MSSDHKVEKVTSRYTIDEVNAMEDLMQQVRAGQAFFLIPVEVDTLAAFQRWATMTHFQRIMNMIIETKKINDKKVGKDA